MNKYKCRNCEHYGKGDVTRSKHPRKNVDKCFLKSDHGNALVNIDTCPKDKVERIED